MPLNTKAIRRRMKSIGNTKKITKAMEMVSAAKMRRAVEAATRARAYAQQARELLGRLSAADLSAVPVLERRPVSRMLCVVVSSNRGLCGSFNANLMRALVRAAQEKSQLARHHEPAIDKKTQTKAVAF